MRAANPLVDYHFVLKINSETAGTNLGYYGKATLSGTKLDGVILPKEEKVDRYIKGY